jgi:phytoene dehydrogenase-like protein
MRTLTASTHVKVSRLRAMTTSDRGAEIGRVQEAMQKTIAALAPEVEDATVRELTASPRTFERFTLRSEGLVGGIPRTAGLVNYQGLGPFEALPGLFLVGDSVFPGQSTLATALGGERTAELIARRG